MRDDFWAEIIGSIAALIFLAICYEACPAKDCKEAVQHCAIADGYLCDEVAERCADKP